MLPYGTAHIEDNDRGISISHRKALLDPKTRNRVTN
jgi:hypothetical protein